MKPLKAILGAFYALVLRARSFKILSKIRLQRLDRGDLWIDVFWENRGAHSPAQTG